MLDRERAGREASPTAGTIIERWCVILTGFADMGAMMDMGDVATWFATLIAAVALLFGWYERREAKRFEKENQKLLEESNARENRRHQLETLAWRDAHFQSVRSWADNVCLCISEARHLNRFDGDYKSKKTIVLSRLSSLIDTGRWYFPNIQEDNHGSNKEPAYRGYRQPILDYVVWAYEEINTEDKRDFSDGNLLTFQRLFVSDIQKVIDPRKRDAEISRFLEAMPALERKMDPNPDGKAAI